MKDFIKKYQNYKLFTNINIILASLVLAIWINFLLIDWTNIGQSLKTSVLDSQVGNKLADIYLQKTNNDIFLIANRNIKDINTLSLSLNYNPENLTITEMNSELWQIAKLWNTPWINSIIVSTKAPKDIKKGDTIIKIIYTKKLQISENINLVNANFSDVNNEQYLLSTSGITF